MSCAKCGKAITVGYMCDEYAGDDDGVFCGDCFVSVTGCTEEAHGEGCETRVFETEDA